MTDPASLTLGLLPLIAGALAAYRSTRQKIRSIKNSPGDIRRLKTKLRCEKTVFTNYCHSLMMNIMIQDSEKTAMARVQSTLSNEDSPWWRDEHNDQRAREWIDSSYNCCRDIVEEIISILDKTKRALECFNNLTPSIQKASSALTY
jgi:hypothetical protein